MGRRRRCVLKLKEKSGWLGWQMRNERMHALLSWLLWDPIVLPLFVLLSLFMLLCCVGFALHLMATRVRETLIFVLCAVRCN